MSHRIEGGPAGSNLPTATRDGMVTVRTILVQLFNGISAIIAFQHIQTFQ